MTVRIFDGPGGPAGRGAADKDRLYQGPFPSYAPEDFFGEEPEVVQYTMPGKQLLMILKNK
ncbi:MAG: hypothetical protein K6G79_05405 [Bacteroidales bacterium]|nr:hypothetical protein [Bacteroidales bacterium]